MWPSTLIAGMADDSIDSNFAWKNPERLKPPTFRYKGEKSEKEKKKKENSKGNE